MAQDQAVESVDDLLSIIINIKGSDSLNLNFSKADSITQVLSVFDVLPQVHHLTSFDLLYKNQALTPDTLLVDLLSSENQKTLTFNLKPKSYSEKSILNHIYKTRDIVGLNHSEVESFGLNAGVSKLNDLELDPIKQVKESTPQPEDGEAKDEQISKPEPTNEEKTEVSNLLSNFFTNLPTDFYSPKTTVTPAVRELYLSSWNPVPLNYKSKGQLSYVVLQTLEGETHHITASTTGFYINKSSSTRFDPSIKTEQLKAFTLYELISLVSKSFLNHIKSNNETLNKVDPITFLNPLTTFLNNPWTTKFTNPTADSGRNQFNDYSNRDFNDEYQSLKELPSKNIQERIVRERLLTKTSFDFTTEAVKGVLSILSGGITPMNPFEETQNHIFLRNGIFYSFGVDASGSFTDKGGNEAARASANQDLQSVKYLNTIDSRGIYTLLTTVVDYAGKRVVCQTPVPGLFSSSELREVTNEETNEVELVDGEPLTKIDYGRDEGDKSIKSSEDFVTHLEPIRKALHFQKQKVDDDVEISTNPDVKGMVGVDRRKYILDLFNATPLDIEFIEANYDENSNNSYPHKQTVVRHEAVQIWYSNKIRELVEAEAIKQGVDLSALLKEGEETPKIVVDEESLSFSVDAFETKEKVDANVRSVSKFITDKLIPTFIEQFDSSSNIVPLTGSHLTHSLHKNGINIRYLGKIASEIETKIQSELEKESKLKAANEEINKEFEQKLIEKTQKIQDELKAKAEAESKGEKYEPKTEKDEEEEEADDEADAKLVADSKLHDALLSIVIQELVARASKHILRSYSADLPLSLVPSLVSHYHNILLGHSLNPEPKANVEDAELYSEEDLEFTKLTPSTVRELIIKDVKIRYRYDLPENWLQRISSKALQREISYKFGIQWAQRDHHFTKESAEEAKSIEKKEKKNKKSKQLSPALERTTTFEPQDVSLAPIIKTSIPNSIVAEQVFEAGREQFLKASKDEPTDVAQDLILEAISIYEESYGQIHHEVQRLYSTVSQLYQEVGLKPEAILFARRAVAISERVFGLDSHETIVALLNLTFLEAETGNLKNSLKIYSRITQIWFSVYGNYHISIPIIVGNVLSSLQENGYLNEATQLSQRLIQLSVSIHGENSYSTAFLRFRLAYFLALQQKYGDAHKEAAESHAVLQEIVSSKHFFTKQARNLRDQALNFKKVQEATAKAAKEQEKQAVKPNAGSTNLSNGKNKKNVDFSNKSVDEVLDFVLGKSKGKGKKKQQKK